MFGLNIFDAISSIGIKNLLIGTLVAIISLKLYLTTNDYNNLEKENKVQLEEIEYLKMSVDKQTNKIEEQKSKMIESDKKCKETILNTETILKNHSYASIQKCKAKCKLESIKECDPETIYIGGDANETITIKDADVSSIVNVTIDALRGM